MQFGTVGDFYYSYHTAVLNAVPCGLSLGFVELAALQCGSFSR